MHTVSLYGTFGLKSPRRHFVFPRRFGLGSFAVYVAGIEEVHGGTTVTLWRRGRQGEEVATLPC